MIFYQKKIPKKGYLEFFKKRTRISKGKEIICIFNYFSTNSTYMKKGSVTSKLKFSFFLQSKFTIFRLGLLPRFAEYHNHCFNAS